MIEWKGVNMDNNLSVIRTDPAEILNDLEKLKNKFSFYLFKSLLSREENEVEVYGKVLVGNDGAFNQISIMSKFMIQCDLAYFNGTEYHFELSKTDYHPYFCEFFIDNIIKINCLKRYIGKWIKMKLTLGKTTKKNGVKGFLLFSASPIIRVKGELQFNDVCENLTKEEIKEIEEVNSLGNVEEYIKNNYDKINKNEIKKKFSSLIEKTNSITGKIYNVGQGNCIYMRFTKRLEADDKVGDNSDVNVFFDVGESIKPSVTADEVNYINLNAHDFSSTDKLPSFIILSHWDLDHILGVSHLSSTIYSNDSNNKRTLWIAPNLALLPKRLQSASAIRLCCYLVKVKLILLAGDANNKSNKNKKSICIIDEKTDLVCLKLWQGEGKNSPNRLNNNIGLFLCISITGLKGKRVNPTQRILFAGDCEYRQMHEEIFLDNLKNEVKYDFIVTSHHGSKNAVFNYKLSRNKSENKECQCVQGALHSRAVISFGVNGYGHPDAEHLFALKRNGFTVVFTPGCQYIEFSVSGNKRLKLSNVN